MKSYILYVLPWAIIFASCKKESVAVTPASPTVKVFYDAGKFIMGADLSAVNGVQDQGGLYKDSGNTKDPFVIFKNHGANTIRVRLWNNPQWLSPYNNGHIYSNIEDVERTLQSAKNAGMLSCLDLHYSDEWADPGNQSTPAAWNGLSLTVLKDSVYQYTLQVLNRLKNKGLTPAFVQIGNETNQGMLFPIGKVVNGDWSAFGTLLKSGIKAVRDFAATADTKPQIILHVAEPENAQYFADGVVNKAGVTDFDILGISYYYVWSTAASLQQVGAVISSLKAKYNKKIIIAETAFPWTAQYADNYNNVISGSTAFNGYEVSKQGQYNYMKDLTQQVITAGGSGIIYWEPGWISSNLTDKWGTGSSWENNAFFDFSGNSLPALDYMNMQYLF